LAARTLIRSAADELTYASGSGPRPEPVDAVVVLPRGLVVGVGVDLPDPAMLAAARDTFVHVEP
jgi:hypothetical protein